METLDNQDVYGALDEEKEFSKKLSQRQTQIILKNEELQRQPRLG